MQEEDYQKVERAALRLVNFRPRFSDELAWKLKEKKFLQTEIEYIIQKFNKLKILDDKNFIKNYIDSLTLNRHWSEKRIKTKLYSLHLNKDFVEKSVSEFFQGSDQKTKQTIDFLFEKKQNQLSNLPAEERKNKLMRFFLARGFDYSDIKEKIKEMEK